MQFTPPGPWEVGARAGPVEAGLLGHTDATKTLHPVHDPVPGGREGVGWEKR